MGMGEGEEGRSANNEVFLIDDRELARCERANNNYNDKLFLFWLCQVDMTGESLLFVKNKTEMLMLTNTKDLYVTHYR